MGPIEISVVDDLDLAFEERPWAFEIDRAAEIGAHWRRLTADNPALFNGRVLLLRGRGVTTAADGRRVFRGAFFGTDYSAFSAFRGFGSPDADVRNGFAMSAVRTADGAYLVGEMAAHTAIAGQVQFPAGTPDLSDISGAHVDLDASAMRELQEETGITPDQVTVLPGWTLVTAGPRIAFMKEMRIAATAAAVVEQVSGFLRSEANPEFSRVFSVSRAGDLVGVNVPSFMRAYLEAKWSAA
jgi:8-oxo-dGTP pyrophosphatase MutT (NUDIX family)